jgi:hypothetical protein
MNAPLSRFPRAAIRHSILTPKRLIEQLSRLGLGKWLIRKCRQFAEVGARKIFTPSQKERRHVDHLSGRHPVCMRSVELLAQWDLLPPFDPFGCTRYAPAFTQKTVGVAGTRRGGPDTGPRSAAKQISGPASPGSIAQGFITALFLPDPRPRLSRALLATGALSTRSVIAC